MIPCLPSTYLFLFTLMLFAQIKHSECANRLIRSTDVQYNLQFPYLQFTLNTLQESESQTQTLFETPFESPPYILLAISMLDMQVHQTTTEYFKPEIVGISTTSFILKVSKQNNNKIYQLWYRYIAIKRSNNIFVIAGEIEFQQNIITSSPGKKIAKKFFYFQRPLMDSETRKISVFYTGHSKTNDLSQQSTTTTNIYTYIEMLSNGFNIVVVSKDPSDSINILNVIYYNYIEFYEPSNGYYQMNQFPDTKYLNSIPSGLFYYDPDSIPISYVINIDYINGIFEGFSGVGFSPDPSNSVGRMKIANSFFSLATPQSDSVYSFGYQTWSISKIDSFSSEVLAFVRVDCASYSEFFFDAGRQCVSSCPQKYYPSSLNGKTFCVDCDTSCLTCSGPSPNECILCDNRYSFRQLCHIEQPANTGCDNISLICTTCSDPHCNKCNYSNTSECHECIIGFSVKDTKCYCADSSQYFSQESQKCINKEDPISEEAKRDIKLTLETAEHVTFGLTLAFVVTQAVTQRGSVLMSSAFTNQKIYYILLLNTDLPNYLYQFTSSLTNQGVLKKFHYLNWIAPSKLTINVGYKFDTEGIASDILENIGGALILLLLTTFFYLLFLLSIRTQYRTRILSIYDRFLGAFFTESIEVSLIVFQFSVVAALSQIQALETTDFILTLCITIFCQSFIIAFIWIAAVHMSRQVPRKLFVTEAQTVEQVIVDKLMNGCMKEYKYSKIYMTIFITIECVLFPILVVTARSQYIVQIIGMVVLQTLEVACTIKIYPFYVKRENVVNIFVQLNMLVIYALVIMIQISLMNSSDRNSIDYPLNVNILSFAYLGIAMLAMITPALLQFYLVVLEIIALIKKKKQADVDEKLGTELMHHQKYFSNRSLRMSQVDDGIERAVKGFQYLKYKYDSQISAKQYIKK